MAERPQIILDTKDLAPFFEREYAHGFNLFFERLLRDHARISQTLFVYETELEENQKLPPEKKNRLTIELVYLPEWIVVDKAMLEQLVAPLHGPVGLEERIFTIALMSHVISQTTKFLKGKLGLLMSGHKVFNSEVVECANHLIDIEQIQKTRLLEESYSDISGHFDSVRTTLLNMEMSNNTQRELPQLVANHLEKVTSYLLYLQTWMASRSKSLVK